MKSINLGLKLTLIVSLMITAIIGVVIAIMVMRTNALVKRITLEEATLSNTSFSFSISSYQKEAHSRACEIALSSIVAHSIESDDEAALTDELRDFTEDIDIITVYDLDGGILASVYDSQSGVYANDRGTLTSILETGDDVSTVKKTTAGGLMTYGGAAIKNEAGDIIAAVACGHDLTLLKYVDELKDSNNCEATLFVGDIRKSTTLTNDEGVRVINTPANGDIADTVLNKRITYHDDVTLFGIEYAVCYSPFIVDGEVLGMLFTGVNIDSTTNDMTDMITWVVVAAVAAGLVCIVLVFIFISFAVSRPLKKIGAFANKIQTGELGLTAPSSDTIAIRSKDEVGVLARILEQAYSQLRGYVGEIRDRMQGLAEGDLVSECEYEFQGDFTLIKDSINRIIIDLNKTLSEINMSATQVATASTHIANVAQVLAQGASEQSSSIDKVSMKLVNMSKETKEKAGNGTTIMDEMVKSVVKIDKASNEIGNIIKVIDNIAFQTNILALNASVEAARAGSYGKGFAVVAEEVKSLASRSQTAAQETKQLIANSLKLADEGAHLASETQNALKSIVEGIEGLNDVMTGIDQVSTIVQKNNITAQESAASSQQMSSQSSIMHNLIDQFKLRDSLT